MYYKSNNQPCFLSKLNRSNTWEKKLHQEKREREGGGGVENCVCVKDTKALK